MTYSELFLKRRGIRQILFRVVGHVLAILMLFSPTLAVAADAVQANRIVTDGRSQTQVQINGTQTDIRTSTQRGGNAFNSFSHFQVGRGNTVNLHVPGQANNLINIVRDSQTSINGTLNGYQSGTIGGNVYFATPNGFVVGKSGTINVGSLTVATPSKAFVEELLGPGGVVGDAAVNRLLSGAFPVSQNGNILIQGQINAKSGVRLLGQTVDILGPSSAGTATTQQTKSFVSSVNSSGLEMGGRIEVTDGDIEIVAAGRARVAGRLKAKRKSGGKAPRINVRSKENIEIESTAEMVVGSAEPHFDGGTVLVIADNHLTVADGATITARGGGSGDGGFVELSGLQTVDIGQVVVDLGATGGQAGTLLIDPADMVIASNFPVPVNGDIHILATNSITVTATGVIDGRRQDSGGNTVGDSRNITLEAPTIVIADGAQVLADVDAGSPFSAGDVTLIATQVESRITGKTTANTSITISGTIRAANVVAKSESFATSSYTDSAVGMAALAGTAVGAALLGLNGGYNDAETEAIVRVSGTADVTATGNVSLTASGRQVATAPIVTIGSLTGVGAAVMYGNVDGTTAATIERGARVSVGGDLSIIAVNDAELSTSALVLTASGTAADGAAAAGTATVTTGAAIQSGANVTVGNGGDVVVFAHNDNDFKVKASVYALGAAKAGL
ncbi:MAG: leukotoxin LktA family filamentous adhesin, partial [Pseudomonadota bacterium]